VSVAQSFWGEGPSSALSGPFSHCVPQREKGMEADGCACGGEGAVVAGAFARAAGMGEGGGKPDEGSC